MYIFWVKKRAKLRAESNFPFYINFLIEEFKSFPAPLFSERARKLPENS